MTEQFIIDNWYLFLALALVVGMMIVDPMIKQMGGVKSVSVMEMPQLTRDASVIVDVSEPGEFKKSRITGAINVPSKTFQADVKKIEKHKKRNVICVCRTGNKAQSAGKELLKNGFEKSITKMQI